VFCELFLGVCRGVFCVLFELFCGLFFCVGCIFFGFRLPVFCFRFVQLWYVLLGMPKISKTCFLYVFFVCKLGRFSEIYAMRHNKGYNTAQNLK